MHLSAPDEKKIVASQTKLGVRQNDQLPPSHLFVSAALALSGKSSEDMNSKESMYSWHLSLRVDRPVEVSEAFVGGGGAMCARPCEVLFELLFVSTVCVFAEYYAFRIAPIFLLDESS